MIGLMIYMGIGALIGIFMHLTAGSWQDAIDRHPTARNYDPRHIMIALMLVLLLAWPYALWAMWRDDGENAG